MSASACFVIRKLYLSYTCNDSQSLFSNIFLRENYHNHNISLTCSCSWQLVLWTWYISTIRVTGFNPYSTSFEIKQQHSTLYRLVIVTALIIIYLGMLFGSLTLFVNKFLYFLLMSSQDFWENLWHQISFLFVSILNNGNNKKLKNSCSSYTLF